MSTTNQIAGSLLATLFRVGSTTTPSSILQVSGNPNGVTAAYGGTLALDPVAGTVYINTSTALAQTTAWTVLAPFTGGKLLWCVVGGAYATLQDAVNAAASGDTILVGPAPTVPGTWGDVTFPAQKLLSVSGLTGAAHSNTVRVGKITYSPTVGTVGQNNLWIENLYVAADFSGSQGILFAGSAPARMRITGMFVSNSSGVGGNCVVSNNSGVGSSLYLDNCLTDDGTVGTMLVHTQGFTQVQDTELHAGSVALSCAAGTVTMYNTRMEYALAGPVCVITGGSVSMTTSFIRNTTGGGSGISVASPGVLLMDSCVFDVATGAGYCVSGNGTFLYGQVTFTNVAVALPRNVKTQNTLTQAQMTQLPTPSP